KPSFENYYAIVSMQKFSNGNIIDDVKMRILNERYKWSLRLALVSSLGEGRGRLLMYFTPGHRLG
ncbi:hypothetical protein, partial [uncultured Mucilaginibacter sp.]|uniref:hypothetical protein n=1 Tax=uncultured Mucilaginibacter sp. TaxID=797541 RepID=UPI0025EEE1D9